MKYRPPISARFLVIISGLVLIILFCSSLCEAGAVLQYAPQYHFFSPGHWIGPPSAPVRTALDGKIDLYAEFNEDYSRGGDFCASQQWYHVSSLNYTMWFRDSPDPSLFLLPPTHWYNQKGSFAGSATQTPSGDVVILYTCVGAYGVARICGAQPMDSRLSSSGNVVLSQSVLNPLVDGDSMNPTSGSTTVRDPTRWWVQDRVSAPTSSTTSTSTAREEIAQPQWYFGVASENPTLTTPEATVALYTSSDPRVLDNVQYAGVLYHDGNFTAFGTPELITLETTGTLTQRFLKLTMLNAERDYIVYGELASGGAFVEDPDRPPSFLDAGHFVAARAFYDPITGTERVVGYLPEDWARESQDGTTTGTQQGWAGALSSVRVIGYSDSEKRLTLAPMPELRALRQAKIFGAADKTTVILLNGSTSQGEEMQDGVVFEPLNLVADATPYHEIVVRFELPDNWMAPSKDNSDPSFAAPEFGLLIRATRNFSAYTTVALKMPTQASCEASGAAGDGVRFRSIPLFDEFDDDNVDRCNQTCTANTICERWDAVLRPYGMDCNMYTLSSVRRSGEVCGTQSGCPLSEPYLVLNRTISGSSGNTTLLRGRAALRRRDPTTVELHVFVDGSIIEVFKDGGLESLSGRVYVPDDQNEIAVYAKNLGSGMQVKAKVTVYTMGSMWAPNGANLYGNDLQEKVRRYTDSFAGLLNTEDLYY